MTPADRYNCDRRWAAWDIEESIELGELYAALNRGSL